MSTIWSKIGVFIASLLLSISTVTTNLASRFVPHQFGANNSFTPVQTVRTYLSGAGVTNVATTVNLTSLLLSDGITPITMSNFGTIGFATIEPGVSKKEENISFTGVTQNANGTAQLTGVIRGLLPVSPYTASTTLAVAHSGGSSLVFSNSAPFYAQFAFNNNTTTIAANWTFNSSTVPQFSSDTPTSTFTGNKMIIDKEYADSLTFSGAPNGSLTQKGIYQEATSGDAAAGNAIGTTGADLVVPSSLHNRTSTATTIVPVTRTNGTLDPNFIDQSAAATYNFLGSVTLTSSTFNQTTFSTTSTFNGPVILNATTTLNGPTVNLFHAKVFSGSAVWIVPTSTYNIYITLVGGGGGGGGGSGSCGGGGGGGSGGYISRFPTSSTPGQSLTITVGPGGAGGAANATGTIGASSTIIGTGIFVLGGSPGSATQTGGAGGSPNGDTGLGGVNGGSNSLGGVGGAGFSGLGGLAASAAGGNGTGVGSGGAGGGCTGTNPQAGGNGATGEAIIEW